MAAPNRDRAQGEADTLLDVKTMLLAATQDKDVHAKLTTAVLKAIEAHVAKAEAMHASAPDEKGAATGATERTLEVAKKLHTVMDEVRLAIEIAHLPESDQHEIGRVGQTFDEHRVDKLADDALKMASGLEKHPDVMKKAGIDKQHLHDLKELAKAVRETHTHHAALVHDRSVATTARDHAFAALRADAHHIRLVARLVHRRNPEGLERFVSPVAMHQVIHHEKKPPPP